MSLVSVIISFIKSLSRRQTVLIYCDITATKCFLSFVVSVQSGCRSAFIKLHISKNCTDHTVMSLKRTNKGVGPVCGGEDKQTNWAEKQRSACSGPLQPSPIVRQGSGLKEQDPDPSRWNDLPISLNQSYYCSSSSTPSLGVSRGASDMIIWIWWYKCYHKVTNVRKQENCHKVRYDENNT